MRRGSFAAHGSLRVLASTLGVLSVLSGVASPAVGADTAGASAAVPRTAWGDPDLQGLWSNGTMTPFTRPPGFEQKEFFTPNEAAAFVRDRLKRQADNPTRGYDTVFVEMGPMVKSLRTSLLIDPKDGKLPAFTPEFQKIADASRERAKAHPADGPEDRWFPERCILYSGAGPAMFPEPYNSQYLIVQTPGYVAIAFEQGHEVRIIPLRQLPKLPDDQRTWLGESRGHWEGDTLVVESSNMRYNFVTSRWLLAFGTMQDGNLHVVERFRRTAPDTILYQATVEDPTVYVRPWTIEYNMYPSKGPFLEVACHEGNDGLREILAGARAEEARAEKASRSSEPATTGK